jgi:hypothetical protein
MSVARLDNVKKCYNNLRNLRLLTVSIDEIEARLKASKVANVLIVIIR